MKFLLLMVLCFSSTAQAQEEPVIENIPIVVNLHEETSVRTELVCIQCTTFEARNFEVSDTKLANAPWFDVYKEAGKTDFCLYYQPSQGNPEYTLARQYDIPVTCTDSVGKATTTTVEVRILTNQPPQITSPLKDTCTIDAKGTTIVGTAIHGTAITVTDADPKDTISFTMTTVPASAAANYEIVPDAPGSINYFIQSTRSLEYECNSDVTFYVNATDGKNNPVGPIVMTCEVTNKHTTPKLTNLDKILYVSEDTVVNTPIFTFVRDPPGDDVTYKLDMRPTSLTGDYFTVPQFTDDLTLIQALNYETDRTKNINLTVTADNTFCPPEPQYLNIRVTDANDPPTLGPNDVTVTVYEGNIDTPTGLKDQDEDTNDELTYSIVKGNDKGYFTIDPTSGDIRSTLDYDIDADARLAKAQLIVQVQDKKGETATATVNLNIQDANDNYPTWASNSTSQTFERSECGAIKNPLGQLWAEDKIDSTFQSNNYVKILPTANQYMSIGEDGVIIQTRQPPAGSVSTLTVNARDEGQYPDRKTTRSPLTITMVGTACPTTVPVVNTGGSGGTGGTGGGGVVTSTTTVVITLAPTTTPTTTTAAPCTDFFCNGANVALTVLGGLLGLALLGLLGSLLYRYCCNRPVEVKRTWTPPKKVRPLTPPTPPRAKTPVSPKEIKVERQAPPPPPPPPALLRVRRLVPIKQQQQRMVKIKNFVPVQQNVRVKQLVPVPGNAPAPVAPK